jgi:hypothetical protein
MGGLSLFHLLVLGVLSLGFVAVVVAVTVIIASGTRPARTQSGPNLRPCPDCGRMVSLSATACPQCGRPMQS